MQQRSVTDYLSQVQEMCYSAVTMMNDDMIHPEQIVSGCITHQHLGQSEYSIARRSLSLR